MGRATGKPKGRPPGAPNKVTADIRAAAAVYSERALSVLNDIMEKGDSASARVAAANSILDRAHGRPKQALDIDANVKAAITSIQRDVVYPKNPNG